MGDPTVQGEPGSPSVPLQDSTEDKVPMCVVGNKVDLREQRPEGSCVSTLQGEKLAKVRFSLLGTEFERDAFQTDGAVFTTTVLCPAGVRSSVL